MILQRELAIGALQFSLGHRPGDTENFVVIAFCVCGQKWPFLVNTKWSLSGGNVFGSGVPTGRGNLLLCSPALKPRAIVRRRWRPYFPGFFATLTIAGRSKRSLNL
jgi:hypothetical protein